jgi:glycine betaine/proline transport system substrate-binding protein
MAGHNCIEVLGQVYVACQHCLLLSDFLNPFRFSPSPGGVGELLVSASNSAISRQNDRIEELNMIKKISGLILVLTGALFASQAMAACGKVSIADMNWSSATVMAHIDSFMLEKGYGCETEIVPGDTMPTGTSMMEKGEPDIAPELWTNSFPDVLEKGVEETRLRVAGQSLSDGGEEGFWVPKYLVEKDPSLATIEGIKKNAKMFKHPEDPELSMFMGCPAGWGCQISSGHLFTAMKLADAGFDYVDPGSGAGLAGAIAKAYERKEPWFGYYWAPTSVLGKYEMVKVDFGAPLDNDHFVNCIAKKDCENPQVSAWPPSPVYTVTTDAFAKRAPDAYAYFTKRAFTNAQMNKLLAWMEDNQADGDVGMEYFIKNHEAIWSKWVDAKVAAKVKAAVADL